MIFRSMAFTTFVSTWVGRFVDPKRTHPNPVVEYVFDPSLLAAFCLYDASSLPLPKDVPMAFRVLPEFILEDVIDYFLFIVRSV